MSLRANDLRNHWSPFTPNRTFNEAPRLVTKGEGMYYWNDKSEKLIDGSAGLFCVAAGHGRKEIADAVYNQLLHLDYAPSFGMGHPGSFELARRIANYTPGDLNHIFFSICGSTAIDSALKIIMAYFVAKNEPARTRFVSRERAYHGVNIGGTSLSGMVKNREVFGGVMPGIVHMRHTWLKENCFTKGQPEKGDYLADDLQRFVDMYGPNTIAACFVEPIAGSTGTLVPPKGYLQKLRSICDKYGILLVFDEVITGWGRTGKAFGADSFGVTPDLMTMAKAVTNGTQPMGVVAVSENIYDTVINAAPEGAIEFFHGYTYSAHPCAVAAAHATLDIYEKEKLFDRAASMSEYFLDSIFSLKRHSIVTDIRGYGMMTGVDVAMDKKPGVRGMAIQKKLFAEGMHVKFTGDCGIVAPPFIAEKKHIDEIVEKFSKVLKSF